MKAKQSAINISLPAALREKLEQKVHRLGAHGSTSEYLRELIRRDLQRDAIDQIDQLLLDGVSSGPPNQWTRPGERRAGRHSPSRRVAANLAAPETPSHSSLTSGRALGGRRCDRRHHRQRASEGGAPLPRRI
jgi:Arc/MetJ-type ribon-helix-helix transcriptional regulator